MTESVLFSIFLIFAGAAIISNLAIYARQSLLLVCIASGMLSELIVFRQTIAAD